jgi:hypothetical protein
VITHLCCEFLCAGQLPYYDLPELGRWFMLDEHWRWTPRGPGGGPVREHRMLIPNNIDTMVETVEPQLRECLFEALPNATDDADGTLFFPVQTCAALPDDAGTLLVAGASFVPEPMAIPLDGADPVDLIMQACREIRFAEVMPANLATTHHPVLQAAWENACNPPDAPPRPGVDFGRDFRPNQQRWHRSEAETRSKELLYGLLSGEQLAEMEAATQFHVQGADGHTYLIRKGHGHNVWRIEGGLRTIEYCIVTRGHVPVYDLMLTQKLLLETDPEHFMAKANSREMTPRRRSIQRWAEDLIGDIDDLDPSVVLPHRPVPSIRRPPEDDQSSVAERGPTPAPLHLPTLETDETLH